MELTIKIISYFAMLLFGGGMFGQLVMFYTKRHDEQKNKRVEFYRMVYDKLAKYYNTLNDILLSFSEHNSIQITKMKVKTSEIENTLPTIQKLDKEIKAQQRRCKKRGRPAEQICEQCNQKREKIIKLYEAVEVHKDEAESIIQDCNDYWKNNFVKIKEMLAPYLNIHNILMSGGKADKKLFDKIFKIDTQSLNMLYYMMGEQQGDVDFHKELTGQMSKITVVMAELSKKISI